MMSLQGARLTISILVKNRVTFAGIVILVAFTTFAIVARLDLRLITPYSPDTPNFTIANAPPSLVHLMGTDREGRDLFTRVMAALPIDIWIPLVVTGLSVIIGVAFGLVAGYSGGIVDEAILRVTDFFFAIPVVIFAIVVSALIGYNQVNTRVYYTALVLIVVGWPIYARLARVGVLNLKRAAYVIAAQASGIRNTRIIRKHIFPQVFTVVLAYATLDMGAVVLIYSVFAFFGLGVAPPTPELGRMVYDGLDSLPQNWWYSVFPGLVLMFLALGFSLVGEGLRDAFDPKIRGQRR